MVAGDVMIGCVDRCVGVGFTSLRPRINSHGFLSASLRVAVTICLARLAKKRDF